MTKSRGGAIIAACWACVAAADQPALQLGPAPRRAVALAVQQICSDLRPIGPVIPYQEDDGGSAQIRRVCFDNFEPAVGSSAPGESYLPSCGLGGRRWWFGSQYRNPNVVNDMTLVAGTAGRVANELEFE
jgi:hypothetical protein